MKKVLVSLFAITLTLGALAQDSTSSMNNMSQHQNTQKHDGVMMRDGKVMMRKNGKQVW